MSKPRALCRTTMGLLCLVAAVVTFSSMASATDYTIEAPDGGDCEALGGTWEDSTSTCYLADLTVSGDDSLTITSDSRITLPELRDVDNFGLIHNLGVIDSSGERGTLVNRGTLENAGLLMLNLVNRLSGLVVNDSQQIQTLEFIENEGLLENSGQLEVMWRLRNTGTLINRHLVKYAGPFPFARFLNLGLLENHGTLDLSLAETENYGIIDNTGFMETGLYPAHTNFANYGLLTNRFGATIDIPSWLHNSGTICNAGTISGTVIGDPPGTDFSDDDLTCDSVDCAPDDSSVWAAPSDVRHLILSSAAQAETTELTWSPALFPGGEGSDVILYDTLSSSCADDFTAGCGDCLESGESDTSATHTIVPPEETALYFLVRVKNPCGENLGKSSNWYDAPRYARECP